MEVGRLGYNIAVVVRILAVDQVGNSCGLATSVSESLIMDGVDNMTAIATVRVWR